MPVKLPEPELLLDGAAIAARIAELGLEVSRHYDGARLSVVAISNGAIPFVADLIRVIDLPLRLDTIPAHSYAGTESGGAVTTRGELKLALDKRRVLLVDDILDTGRTLSRIADSIRRRHEPEELKTCVLLDKPARREIDIEADFVGFKIPDEFVVGYGMDYNEYYRNLPYIGILRQALDC